MFNRIWESHVYDSNSGYQWVIIQKAVHPEKKIYFLMSLFKILCLAIGLETTLMCCDVPVK